MKVVISQSEPLEVGADLVVVGLHEDGSLPVALADLAGAGDAKGAFKKKLLLHAGYARVLVIGLGKREDADAERLRVVAALAAKEATRLELESLAWALPEPGDDAAAEALVTGTILGAYRFDRFKGSNPAEPAPPALGSLTSRTRPPTWPRRAFSQPAPRRSPPTTMRSRSTCSGPSRSPPREWAGWSRSTAVAASPRG